MANTSQTNKTQSLKIRMEDNQWAEIPSTLIIPVIPTENSPDYFTDNPNDKNVVYYFQPIAGSLSAQRFQLSTDGVENLQEQLTLPDAFLDRAQIFGSEFLTDMNELRMEHPFLFYGGTALVAGAIVILLIPSLSGFVLLGPVTAGLAVKGSLFGLGGFGLYKSIANYNQLDDLHPTTPLSQYHIEREKIVEVGTGITAAFGMAILSAETIHMLSAAKAAQVAEAAELTPAIASSSWRSALIACATYCHPDELALIFANTEKTAHALTEKTGYLCQHDSGLNQWACVEESQVNLSQLDVVGSNSYSIALPQSPSGQSTASPTEAE